MATIAHSVLVDRNYYALSFALLIKVEKIEKQTIDKR